MGAVTYAILGGFWQLCLVLDDLVRSEESIKIQFDLIPFVLMVFSSNRWNGPWRTVHGRHVSSKFDSSAF
jgi:hypothetical protein